jgi:hypothetical protein
MPHRARSFDSRNQVQAKLMLAGLGDLALDLAVVELVLRPDAVCYAAETKAVLITKWARLAGSCPKWQVFGL